MAPPALADDFYVVVGAEVDPQVGVAGTHTYAYDALGRRVSKTVNNVTTTYINNADWQEIAEYQGANLVQSYVYGSYIDEALCMVKANGDRFFYSTNDLYSVYALTDGAGTVVERYCYDPYGAVTVMDGNGTPRAGNLSAYGNSKLFCGYNLDVETGLLHTHNRYLSPELGRFLERNPWGYNHSFVHLYDYVSNRVTTAVEPFSSENGVKVLYPFGHNLREYSESNPNADVTPQKSAAFAAANLAALKRLGAVTGSPPPGLGPIQGRRLGLSVFLWDPTHTSIEVECKQYSKPIRSRDGKEVCGCWGCSVKKIAYIGWSFRYAKDYKNEKIALHEWTHNDIKQDAFELVYWLLHAHLVHETEAAYGATEQEAKDKLMAFVTEMERIAAIRTSNAHTYSSELDDWFNPGWEVLKARSERETFRSFPASKDNCIYMSAPYWKKKLEGW